MSDERKYKKMFDDVIRRTDLTASAKLVYASLADREGNNGYSWPGVRTIAKDVGMSKGAAERGIASLEAKGLLVITHGGRNGNRYQVVRSVPKTETPQNRDTVPETDTPCPQNEDSGVPIIEIVASPKRVHNQTKESDSKNQTKEPDAFDVFWKAYPGKKGGGKEKLRKKWKLDKLDSKAEHVMAVVAAKKTTEQWTKDNGQYIPMLSTFLNQQRWDCDIADITAAPTRKTVEEILADGENART